MAVTEVVESVHFKFTTEEEVRSHSVVEITNPQLLDDEKLPVAGGLYDAAMGPLIDRSACTSCGLGSWQCPGRCGHIELVSSAYNPLLFNKLGNLLNKTCFTCYHFRARTEEVENCVAQLELIAKGNISATKKLSMRQALQDKKKVDWVLTDEEVGPEDSQRSATSQSSVLRGGGTRHEQNNGTCWDSCQLTEAMSVLNEFLKKKEKKCKNCDCNNPKINKPTFGWFHVSGLSSSQIRSNAIRSSRLNVTHSGGDTDNPSSEVVDDSEAVEANSFAITSFGTKKPSEKGANQRRNLNHGAEEPSNYYSGPLLPSEVKDILRRLWENEAPLCSYICNIQQNQSKFPGNIMSYHMFFLDTILVPPIRFRPAAKVETVMDHPHTVLLEKVLR